MTKTRITIKDGTAYIYAKRKDTGKLALFGTCHPATAALIRKDGIRPHAALIRIASL